jgi:hypothetical protein
MAVLTGVILAITEATRLTTTEQPLLKIDTSGERNTVR